MISPKHLWRGDWRADSESARETAERDRAALLERPPEEAPEESPEAPGPSRRSLWLRRLVAAALVVGIVAIAAVALTSLIGGDGASDPQPAARSRPLERRPGETRAAAVYRVASPAVVSIRTSAGSGTGFVI